jgi:hypothetical protein
MGKVIQVTFASATATKGKRYIAKSESAHVTTDYNPHLTDSANQRFAANACIREMNLDADTMLAGIKWEIVASGTMPDGKSVVYIAEEV